ncbi:MAG: hypothetical protein OXR67_08070 [Chloroflexota bacterium]|nr:hypothetical protein [Chloroflexota bacterium]
MRGAEAAMRGAEAAMLDLRGYFDPEGDGQRALEFLGHGHFAHYSGSYPDADGAGAGKSAVRAAAVAGYLDSSVEAAGLGESPYLSDYRAALVDRYLQSWLSDELVHARYAGYHSPVWAVADAWSRVHDHRDIPGEDRDH